MSNVYLCVQAGNIHTHTHAYTNKMYASMLKNAKKIRAESIIIVCVLTVERIFTKKKNKTKKFYYMSMFASSYSGPNS